MAKGKGNKGGKKGGGGMKGGKNDMMPFDPKGGKKGKKY